MCPCKHLLFYFMVLLWLWQILFASALSFQIWFIKWLIICLPSISLHISIFRINFIKGSKNTLQIKRIWERNRFHFWCYLRFSFNLHKGFMHLILPNLSNKCYWITDLKQKNKDWFWGHFYFLTFESLNNRERWCQYSSAQVVIFLYREIIKYLLIIQKLWQIQNTENFLSLKYFIYIIAKQNIFIQDGVVASPHPTPVINLL